MYINHINQLIGPRNDDTTACRTYMALALGFEGRLHVRAASAEIITSALGS